MKKHRYGGDIVPFPTRPQTPEALAKRAIARAPTTPSGHRVKLALTLYLPALW
jgi:hypothetical protein